MKTPFCLLLVAALGVNATAANSAKRQENSNLPEWEQFRAVYPYHIQTLALGDRHSDGRRVLIISEPPPSITATILRTLDPATLSDLSIKRHQVGFDGWVQDVVVSLPPLDDSALAVLVDKLHQVLFGTTYKAYVIPIGSGHPPRAPNLDLRVTASDLDQWLLRSGTRGLRLPHGTLLVFFLFFVCVMAWSIWRLAGPKRNIRHLALLALCSLFVIELLISRDVSSQGVPFRFRPITGGDPVSCVDVLNHALKGVFLSDRPGLVLWSFPRNEPLRDYAVEAREFTLDSDLILGAVASTEQIAIVGRERVVPVTILPPLRSETIMLLASTNKGEIAQSIERKHFFAGKFESKEDWAPTFLSDELVDTEYGSLLNITDQMLKSWSMHGDVRYVHFDYPDPPTFPFAKPLLEEADTTELTFNWNTKGFGYVTDIGGFSLYALNRTGALPVDYYAGRNRNLLEKEDVAYNYFAQLSDPNLVRVVQYASLYQIFKRFQITTPSPAPAVGVAVPKAFTEPLRHVLKSIKDLPEQFFTAFDRLQRSDKTTDGGADENLSELKTVVDAITEAGKEQELINAVASPRLFLSKMHRKEELDESDKLVFVGMRLFEMEQQELQALFHINIQAIAHAYVAESQREHISWIRTPSIVLSEGVGQFAEKGVGGHNLDATVTEFSIDTSLNPGQIRVSERNGHRTILYSPNDERRIADAVREAGRDDDRPSSDIEQIVMKRMTSAEGKNRAYLEILGFTSTIHPASLRGLQRDSASDVLHKHGWELSGQQVEPEEQRILARIGEGRAGVVVVRREKSGDFSIAYSGADKLISAANIPSATDALLASISVLDPRVDILNIHLQGMNVPEGQSFLRTVESRLSEKAVSKLVGSIGSVKYPDEMVDVMSQNHDLSRASIDSTSVPSEAGHEVVIDLHLAGSQLPRVGPIVELRLLFRAPLLSNEELSAEALSAVKHSLTGSGGRGPFVDAVERLRSDVVRSTGAGLKSSVVIYTGGDVGRPPT